MVLVLLIAEHRALRDGLATLVDGDAAFSLAIAATPVPSGVLDETLVHRPDVLLLALRGALANRGRMIRDVRRASPQTAVVVAGAIPGRLASEQAIDAGAFAYVSLDELGPELLDTLGAAAAAAAL